MQNENNSYLSQEQQAQMRMSGLLRSDEVAIRIADVVVAENVITRERRVISDQSLQESRRVLRG